MVVDDNEDDRREIIRLLVSLGYGTIEFSDEGAIEYLKDNEADLVILDLMLEDTSGIDLCGKIREVKPGQKCIIVSGFLNSSDCRRAADMGITRGIEKPLNREKLGSIVRAELDRS